MIFWMELFTLSNRANFHVFEASTSRMDFINFLYFNILRLFELKTKKAEKFSWRFIKSWYQTFRCFRCFSHFGSAFQFFLISCINFLFHTKQKGCYILAKSLSLIFYRKKATLDKVVYFPLIRFAALWWRILHTAVNLFDLTGAIRLRTAAKL